jgi:hypothetical protein
LVITSCLTAFKGKPAATRGFNGTLINPLVSNADMTGWEKAVIGIMKE